MYFELSFKRERYLSEEGRPKTIVLPSAEISSKVIRLTASKPGAIFFPFLFHLTVANIYGRRYRYLGNWIFLSEEEMVHIASSHAALVAVADNSITLGKHVQFLRSASALPFAAYAEGKAFSSPIPRVKVEYLKELVFESEKI